MVYLLYCDDVLPFVDETAIQKTYRSYECFFRYFGKNVIHTTTHS